MLPEHEHWFHAPTVYHSTDTLPALLRYQTNNIREIMRPDICMSACPLLWPAICATAPASKAYYPTILLLKHELPIARLIVRHPDHERYTLHISYS
jgi:hypothetical protein